MTCRSCASASTTQRSIPRCLTPSASAAPTPPWSSSVSTAEENPAMEGLMKGKRGLVMGVANDHSIAWGIAKKLSEQGAGLAFTYQGEAFGRRVKPLAEQAGASLVLPCDVEDSASVAATFETMKENWGGLDFVVHAIGFSDKNELKGLYADTSRENFVRTMVISCYSFTEVARH